MARIQGVDGFLPDFIVLGAQKAGTKSIYFNLRKNPGVFVTDNVEIHFFNQDYHYNKGLQFYSSYFQGADGSVPIGEITPAYLREEAVPERIAACLPDVKLIACLRNPVDRAFSSYRMQKVMGSETMPLLDALKSNPMYIEGGMYHDQISRYLKYFDRDRLLIMLFDDLKADAPSFHRRIIGFLGGDTSAALDLKRYHETGVPKHKLIPRVLNVAYRMQKVILAGPLRGLVDNSVVHPLFRRWRTRIAYWNAAPARSETIDPEAKAYMVSVFRDDVAKLSGLIGRDLSHWLSN